MLPRLKDPQKAVELLRKLSKLDSPAFPDLLLTFVRSFDIASELKQEAEWVLEHNICSFVVYKVARQTSLGGGNKDRLHVLTQLWKRNKEQCLGIGRDLVRVLPDVAGLEGLWGGLLEPDASGESLYLSILRTPTDFKHHKILLSLELEKRLVYVIEQAPLHSYAQYLKWIVESCDFTVIPDIVRFVVSYKSGSQESVPRWQIVQWLLSETADVEALASAKQALVFDCLFHSKLDSLNSVEPLMSLLRNALKTKPALCDELLDFLLLSCDLYDQRAAGSMRSSVKRCFSAAREAGIMTSLEDLANDARINVGIRQRLGALLDTNDADLSAQDSKRDLCEFFGESGRGMKEDPSIELLMLLLEEKTVTDEMGKFVLNCLDLNVVRGIEGPKGLLKSMFLMASSSRKLLALIRTMAKFSPEFSVALLLFSLNTESSIYFQLENNLERDLTVPSIQADKETLRFIYKSLFSAHPDTITVAFTNFLLRTASPELMFSVATDLKLRHYTVVSPLLEELLLSSNSLCSTAQLYLWKLIQAESSPELLTRLLQFASVHPLHSYESLSGLLQCLLYNGSPLLPANLILLQALPSPLYSSFVSSVLHSLSQSS